MAKVEGRTRSAKPRRKPATPGICTVEDLARVLEERYGLQPLAALSEVELRRCVTILRDPETLAALFHVAYEKLAPKFGYDTRKASAVPWDHVPEPNRSLMIATAREVAYTLLSGKTAHHPAEPQKKE